VFAHKLTLRVAKHSDSASSITSFTHRQSQNNW